MSEQHWDVVVIGAGFSGLTAARDLTEQGFRVLVVEGRDRPGGRTWYRKFADTDHFVEMGGTWVSRTWMPEIMTEIDRYGIELVDEADCKSFAWVTGGQRREHAPIPPEEFGAAERALTAVHAAIERTPNGELIEGEDYSDLDLPVSEWSPFAALPVATREFVYAWASMYSGSNEHEVSVMHFSMMLASFGKNVAALHFGLSQRFKNGTRSLIEAIEGDLAEKVRYSTRVTGIEQDDVVKISTDAGVLTADRVICTVPINSLHRLEFSPTLPEQAAGKVAKGTYSKSLKSWSLCRNVPEGFVGVGWKTGIEWAMPVYRFDNGTALVCGFGHDKAQLDPSDAASVEAALRNFIPEVEVLAIDTHSWNDDEFADGTSMIVDPGWIASGDALAFAKPHDRVHFAGADHSLVFTGWMEGAVRSGKSVAAKVAESFASRLS